MPAAAEGKPFKVHGIELISFSIQPKKGESANNLFEFNIKQESKTNLDKFLIVVFTKITIKEAGSDLVLSHFDAVCSFKLENFENHIKKGDGDNYVIPHELNVEISRISVATCRGMLYCQLRGTYLQNIILPLLPNE